MIAFSTANKGEWLDNRWTKLSRGLTQARDHLLRNDVRVLLPVRRGHKKGRTGLAVDFIGPDHDLQILIFPIRRRLAE